MKSNLISFCLVAITAKLTAGNTCDMKCGYVDHIRCGNKGFNPARCPQNAKLIPMDPSLQQLVLDAHNEKRNLIAGGQHPKYKPACRMATMEWDSELAAYAALNVQTCEYKHDFCHKTNAFQDSGQNLYYAYRNPVTGFYDAEMLKNSIDMWYAELEYINQNVIDKFYPVNNYIPEYRHFTVMMIDRNIRVGCAAVTYTKDNTEHYLVACNYASQNILNVPIYEKCDLAGMRCNARNNKYPNLCSESEQYNVNDYSIYFN